MNKETYQKHGVKELQQDDQYLFPYHYLPRAERGAYSQHMQLVWGYEYYSYIQFVCNIVQRIAPKSLLDVGCGEGRFMYELQKILHIPMLGVDVSKRAIALANAMNPAGTYESIDIGSHTLAQQYDIVTLIETLEHIKPSTIPEFIAGIARNTAKGGQLIITVPTTNVPVNTKHYQHFTAQTLAAAVQPFFTIEQVYYLNKTGVLTSIIQSLFNNRFFTMQWKPLRKILYAFYASTRANASGHNGKRICVVCTKV